MSERRPHAPPSPNGRSWRRRILLTVVALVIATGAGAEPPDWNRQEDPLRGALGLHVGKIGGSGLAFRGPLFVWFLQWQVAGGIWNTEDHRRHNVGLEINFLLRQDPRLRVYLLGGAGYYYHKQRYEEPPGSPGWQTDTTVNAGFGVGMEYLLASRWSVKVDADFTYEGDDQDLILWPQAGIFFYW